MSALSSRRLRLGFGLALLTALIVVVGPRALAATLAAADPARLAAGAATYAALVAVKTGRWLRLLRLQGISLPVRVALRAYGLGMLLGAVTPGRVGQHVKAAVLVGRGVAVEEALAGSLVDQLLDMLVVALLVPLAVGYFGASLSGSLWLGAASVALAALGLLLLGRLARGRFARAAQSVLRLGRRALGLPLALALVSTLLYFVTLGLVGRAVGIGVGGVTLALASVASGVVEMAPVTVAGLGTREAALLALLRPLGVEARAVLALTLVVRALQVGTGAIAYAVGAGRPPGRDLTGAGY